MFVLQNEIPCRIYCGIIESDVLRGRYDSNYFVFKRKFTRNSNVVRNSQDRLPSNPEQTQGQEQTFSSRLMNLFRDVVRTNQTPRREELEMDQVLPPGFRHQNYEEPSNTFVPSVSSGTTSETWIKSCVLTLNGKSISSLDSIEADEHSGSPAAFLK